MQRRRGQSDPFLNSRRPQWLVVSTVGGEIVSVERLPPGTNLEQSFLNTVHHHRSEGWIIENDPTYPCVFAHKNDERRMLTICHIDPAGAPLRHFSPWQN
jgi:hypothetical protein